MTHTTLITAINPPAATFKRRHARCMCCCLLELMHTAVGHFIFRWDLSQTLVWDQSLRLITVQNVLDHVSDRLSHHRKKISVFGPWQLLFHPKLWHHSWRICFVYICLGEFEVIWSDTLVSDKLNSTSIYGHRCKHLNVRIYLTQLHTKLHIFCYMYWSISNSGQFGCVIIQDILVHPKLV